MSCSCNRERPTRPIETCIFCAHKHISSACAILPEAPEDFRNSMIVGQLSCAALHYNGSFPDMSGECLEVINRIHVFENYTTLLSDLRNKAWSMVVDNQNSKIHYPLEERKRALPSEASIEEAHIAVSTSKALYDLELSYKSVNKSDSMGMLIVAAWHLQGSELPLALKCRNLWGKIEHLQDCGEELTDLERDVWNLICVENKSACHI